MKGSSNFLQRVTQLQKGLITEKIDVLLIDQPIDLFYLTGIEMSRGYLYIREKKAALFVDGRYLEAVTKKSPVPVHPLSDDAQVSFLKGAKMLAFDGSRVTVANADLYKKLARKTKVKVQTKSSLVKKIRLIKDKSEIAKMKKSAEFAYQAYSYIKKKAKPGVSEIELARDLEIYCLKNGAEKISFSPIIAFGKNSALPHHHPGKTILKQNDLVLFDLGVILNGYCSDMTRTAFIGKGIPAMRKLEEVNRAAQRVALAKCKPGVKLKELDLAVRRVMASADLEHLFIHNLGHGIGLEVHESPSIHKKGADANFVLQEGMAITVEPGLYLPGKGGVRYEDTIVITQKGYTNLYPEV